MKTKENRIKKLIAFVLTLVVTFTALPANTFFATEGNQNTLRAVFTLRNGYDTLVELDREITCGIGGTISLKEFFGAEYVEPTPAEGQGAFLGWSEFNGDGTIITGDDPIIIDSSYPVTTYQAEFENNLITVRMSYLTSSGNQEEERELYVEQGTTYQELLDSLEVPVAVNGYTFLGWAYNEAYYQTNTDVSGIISENLVPVVATYDKYPVEITKAYVDETGKVVQEKNVKDYPAGTLVDTIEQEATTVNAPNSTGWFNKSESFSQEISVWNRQNFNYNATYVDKNIVNIYTNITVQSGDYGKTIADEGYYLMDKVDCASEASIIGVVTPKLTEKYNIYKKEMFNGFVKLQALFGAMDYNGDGSYDFIYLNPSYDLQGKYITVTLANMPLTDGSIVLPDSNLIMYAEKGTTITLPAHYNGWTLSWKSAMDGKDAGYSYTIPADAMFANFMATVTGKYVAPTPAPAPVVPYYPVVTPTPETTPETETEAKQTETTRTETATPEETPVVEEKPVVEIKEEKIEVIKEEIVNAIEEAINAEVNGEEGVDAKPVEVVIDMKNEDGTVATVVPKDILEVAKGKNVDVVLEMDGYSWTINGNSIDGADLQNINLEVTFNQNVIPTAYVEALAQGLPTQQLSLTHNGEFGFTANLTINVEPEYVGQYGNLYYFHDDMMEFMNAGLIDENGNVSLEFSHASEYVVVIGEDMTAKENATDDVEADAEGGVVEELPAEKSGSVMPIILVVVVVIIAVAVVVLKKKKENE